MHNEELQNPYSTPNIIRMIKWRKMRCVGHGASLGEKRNVHRLLWGGQNERYHWDDLDVSGRILLKRILDK
jgi:hypothetical protein